MAMRKILFSLLYLYFPSQCSPLILMIFRYSFAANFDAQCIGLLKDIQKKQVQRHAPIKRLFPTLRGKSSRTSSKNLKARGD
jgi:hypothetical protein